MIRRAQAIRSAARPFAFVAAAIALAGCVTAQAPVARMAQREAPVTQREETRPVAIAPARPKPVRNTRMASLRRFEGVASYYSHGTRVASGARFDPDGLTAAHPSLPFGTRLEVRDPKTGKSVVVTVNDRGPFVRGRVLDLSRGAARVLGMEKRGVNRIQAQVL